MFFLCVKNLHIQYIYTRPELKIDVWCTPKAGEPGYMHLIWRSNSWLSLQISCHCVEYNGKNMFKYLGKQPVALEI